MAATGMENFIDYFVNTSDSIIVHRLPKLDPSNGKQPDKIGGWNVYIVALLLSLIVTKRALFKRKPEPGYMSFSDTLQYLNWIPFVKLPLLDSIIVWYKLRQDGLVKLTDSIIQRFGTKLNGKFNLGFKPIVAVSDPNIIQKLLSSTSHAHLSKSDFLYAHLFTSVMKDGLLAGNVNIWANHRKVVSPAFKYTSFPTYFKFIFDEAKELAQTASADASKTNSESVCNQDMKKLIDHHAVKMVMHLVMGSESFSFFDESMTVFEENFKKVKELTVMRFQKPQLMFPPLWWLHPMKKEMDMAIEKLVKYICRITDKYRMQKTVKDRQLQEKTNSVLHCEKDSKDHSEKILECEEEDGIGIKSSGCLIDLMIKSGLDNKEIVDEVATFLITGHETVKVALDLLIFQLALHQEHQNTCIAEVDNLFDSKHDGEEYHLNLEDFSKLKYLEMCILESMRLTPTVPGILRHVQEPLRIDDNYIIPAGELVAVPIWMVHRHPDIYPNPKKFDPNRFLPENVKQRHPYAFIPFSMGARNCIGWKVALLELKVIMAWILRYFEVHTTDGPNDVKLLFDITLKTERPYNVTFKKRVPTGNTKHCNLS